MLLLDVSLRFATVTLLLLMAFLSWRDARHLLQGRIATVYGISLAAMLVNTLPLALDPPAAIKAAAWFLHMPNIALLWLFGLSLFEDGFRMTRIHWVIPLAFFPILITLYFAAEMGMESEFLPVIILNRVLGFSVLAHLLWTAVKGYRNDLVEVRRRTRLWFIIVCAVAAFVIVGGETFQYFASGGPTDPEWFKTARVAIIFPIVLFSIHWFLRLQPEQFLFEGIAPAKPHQPSILPKDNATHTRLIAAMETDYLYREQGLSIGGLSQKLNVPEHQLRALINKGLGFRNFAAFLNQYRLSEAKTALADPEQARTPILTIAMDAGYASLATFNRAFKSEEETTPSDFRSKALTKAAQS